MCLSYFIFVDSCLHYSKWYCSVARVHQSTIGMHTLINSDEFECNSASPRPLERKQGFCETMLLFFISFFLERFLVRCVYKIRQRSKNILFIANHVKVTYRFSEFFHAINYKLSPLSVRKRLIF